jgi:hypothetical protein
MSLTVVFLVGEVVTGKPKISIADARPFDLPKDP